MGGNALKDCVTRRYNADEYFILEEDVLKKLRSLFPFPEITPTKSYKNKPSYGDMDILIDSEFMTEYMIISILDEFQPKQMFKNGNCLSFEYKEFQIDLIACGKDYKTSQDYFAYNDLGNLCGRIAHSMGLKLGHDGLSYNFKFNNDTYLFKNVLLLTEWEDILPVLGLSYERYAQGFAEMEDIFKFVVSSRFFNKHIFALENRNHTSRVRDAKRKTYTEFLAYIKPMAEHPLAQAIVMGKEAYLPYLKAYIYNFTKVYNENMYAYEDECKFKLLYNGDRVSKLTGLVNKELGKFMQWVKQYYGATLQRDILHMNPDCINSWITHMYKKYSNTLDIVDFRA